MKEPTRLLFLFLATGVRPIPAPAYSWYDGTRRGLSYPYTRHRKPATSMFIHLSRGTPAWCNVIVRSDLMKSPEKRAPRGPCKARHINVFALNVIRWGRYNMELSLYYCPTESPRAHKSPVHQCFEPYNWFSDLLLGNAITLNHIEPLHTLKNKLPRVPSITSAPAWDRAIQENPTAWYRSSWAIFTRAERAGTHHTRRVQYSNYFRFQYKERINYMNVTASSSCPSCMLK